MDSRRKPSATAALLLAWGLVGCDRPLDDRPPVPPVQPDVYLLLIDTLRADHLSLYGYERPTSPNLDRFAESATVFENVVATAPWTLPSVGSVMTGLYPTVHGLRARKRAKGMTGLRPAVETLAELLASQGYRTAAIVANPWLIDVKHGLARGFEEFVPLSGAQAPRVHARALEIISQDDPRPLFLYLHYMDPHGPYDRRRDLEPADLGPLAEGSDRMLTKQERKALPKYLKMEGQKGLGPYLRGYDQAIRAWDDSFGEWIAWLDARKSHPAPLIALISDHGEEFLEHGGWNHGETLFEEQLSVPWVLRLPDRPPGRVSDRVVSLVDVAPTLLTAVGLAVPENMTGRNVLADEFQPDRPVFAETEVRKGGIPDKRFMQRAVRRGNTKQIQGPSGLECYDLASDRSELDSDCAAVSWHDRASEDLERWIRESKVLAASLGAAAPVRLDAEQQERLRAIGYLE